MAEAPEPERLSSDTEVSEQAETPASEPRVRRSDAEDYASRFLKNTPSEARQCVYRPAATPQDHDPRGRCGQPAFYGRELHRQRMNSTSSVGTERKYGVARSAPATQ